MPKNKFQEVIFHPYHGIFYGLRHDLLQHFPEHREY